MKTDIEIAREAKMLPISEIAKELGIENSELELYGNYKAKINDSFLRRTADRKDGKLILVTAINPTPAGEGKTTTTVGLGMAMRKIGKNAIIALREPSLGPVFGVKGGAAGGGYAQVVPMEDINLHFTGDFHAITAANNLLSAMIDNHIQQGNDIGIDPRRILFARVTDTNDRALRNVIVGLGSKADGVPRQDKFMITVASEIMAILCLSESISDLKERLGNILVAYTYSGAPVYCKELRANGAMAALLKDAIKPNLVQTVENTPALIHGGPFANIAHGCNSVRATKLALKLCDYTITEAGFGADLGAEKFLDIKCRKAGLTPDAVVLVATVRALKYNGGVPKAELSGENLDALKAGAVNLEAHIDNLRKYGLPVVVAINRFHTDTDAELAYVEEICKAKGADFALSEVFAKGGNGGIELAQKVVAACEKEKNFTFMYEDSLSIKEKIEALAAKIYGASEVKYDASALKSIAEIEALDPKYSSFPICVAKTQYSLSDDASLLGRPTGFTLTVREVKLSVCETENGTYSKEQSFGGGETNSIVSLGESSSGELYIKAKIKNDNNNFYVLPADSYVYYIDMEVFKDAMARLAKTQFIIDPSSTDSHLTGTVTTDMDRQLMFTSIPFDEGWNIYVDGEKVETMEANDSLVAFYVDGAGEHSIEMKYMPKTVALGIIVSLTCLGIFILILLLYPFVKNLLFVRNVIMISGQPQPRIATDEYMADIEAGDIGSGQDSFEPTVIYDKPKDTKKGKKSESPQNDKKNKK